MSAGICILNKNAIAMAADSAVTIGNHLAVHNSANKLFSMSRIAPVGAIIYSSTSLMGVPFELIIKEYKKKIGDFTFPLLKDYFSDFVNFIERNKDLFLLEQHEESYIKSVFVNLISGLNIDFRNAINKKIQSIKRQLKKEEEKAIAKEACEQTLRFIDSFEKNSDSAFYDYVKDKYSLSFYSIIKSDKTFEWIDDEYARFISEKSCLLYDTKFERNGYVGFAIAGYGDNEIFPQLTHVHVQGYINGKLKYHIVENVSISDNTIASIVPLAQTDVMQTFLFGINDSFLNELSNTIPNELLNTIGDKTGIICADRTDDFNVLVLKSRDSIVSKMANKAKAEYMKPIIISVSTLPIEEMALLAESMINITSLRRKVALDNNIGTVGGPIDVSIISKGDGFIWLKRKHYFDRKLNPQYFYSHFESNKEVNEE